MCYDSEPEISIGNVIVNEYDDYATFDVGLSWRTDSPVTVFYMTSDNTAESESDYTATSGSLIIPACGTGGSISVPIIDDTLIEAKETFDILLFDASGASLADAFAEARIISDDVPSLTVNDVSLHEDTGVAVMQATLSEAAATVVTFDFATADGTAKSSEDYTAQGSSYSLPIGGTTVNFIIPVTVDSEYEPDETLELVLSNVVGASVEDGVGELTILNDDLPAVSVGDVIVDEDAGDAVFSVTLQGPAEMPVTFDFATFDGLATEPTDYGTAIGSHTFAIGETVKTIEVPIVDDDLIEANETFYVRLSNVVGAPVGDDLGKATIVSDDMPDLSIGDVSVDEDTGVAVLQATLSEAAATVVTFSYATSNGTATSPSDYTAQSGSYSLPVGGTAVNFIIPIVEDTVYEDDETLQLVLSSVAGATLIDGIGDVTILNDDLPAISVDDVTVDEDAGTAVFSVTLDHAADTSVSLDFATVDDTATAAADYNTASGSLTFAIGETSKTITVPLVDDLLAEGSESFDLVLSNVAGAALSDGTGQATIVDNDVASVNINDVTVDETAGTAVFDVTLSLPSSGEVTLHYYTWMGTALAGHDYDVASGSVVFASGETAKTIGVSVIDDSLVEDDETFEMRLVNIVGATAGDTIGQATIVSDEVPSLSISDVSIDEDAGVAELQVTLDQAAVTTVTVDYSTANGTASAPGDYTSTSGSLIFAAGEQTKTITVSIVDDSIHEPDETLDVVLSNAVGAAIYDGTGQVTIVDDEVVLSINDVSVNEDAGVAVLQVTLNQAAGTVVTFDYATANGTATAPSDYTAQSNSYSLPVGGTAANFIIPIVVDSVYEPDETLQLVLSNVVGATLLDGVGQVTILNDDLPAISVGDITVDEDAGSAVFSVTLDQAADTVVSLDYATTDDTATAPADYGSTSGSLTLAVGESSKTVTVPLADDQLAEGAESFDLVLSNVVGAALADGTGTATIVDDDVSVVNINDLIVNESAGTAVFDVTLSLLSSVEVTLDYYTWAGTALAGHDYHLANGSLVFASGETSKTISVSIIDDSLVEGDESFEVRLSNIAGAETGDLIGQATVVSDDVPSLSIGDVSVDEDAGVAVLPVTLDQPAATVVTLDYATANNSATSLEDYDLTSGSLTFAAGEQAKTITVPIVDDNTYESDETFDVALSNAVGATIADGVGEVTIFDNEIVLSVSDISIDEDEGSAVVQVAINQAASTVVTFDYATADGTATASSDYTARNGSYSLRVGATAVNFVIPVVADSGFEPDETFQLVVSNVSGAILTDGIGEVTIRNDDLPAVSVGDVTVDEDAGTAVFSVTLAQAADTAVSFDFATADDTATAPADYSSTGGSRTFAVGETSKTITVTLTDDQLAEGAESFDLVLSNVVGAALPDGTATATIVDDDVSVVNINDVTVNESAGTAVFDVTLSVASSVGVFLDYYTWAGTALAGHDYHLTNGSLFFASGETSKTISVSIIDDSLVEDDETFEVRLANIIGGEAGDLIGQGTILNDDIPSLSIADVSVNEDAGTASFNVTLDQTPTSAVTVDYATADGTATAPEDYTSASDTLTFAVGEQAKTITVPIVDDSDIEADETFDVVLSNVAGATIADGTGQATIVNADLPLISIGDVTVNEDAGTASFSVTLAQSPTAPVTLDYATVDGTATAPADYTSATSSLSFAVGEQTRTIQVAIADDTIVEVNETFSVILSNVVGAAVSDGIGQATIVSSDLPSVSIGDVTVDESTGVVSLSVTLDQTPTAEVTIDYATADGSAAAPGDYTSSTGSLSFSVGEQTRTIHVTVLDDDDVEAAETLTVVLSNVAGATIADATGQATILSEDLPSLSIDDVFVYEDAGTADFIVTLDQPPVAPVTFDYAIVNGTATAPTDYTTSTGSRILAVGELTHSISVPIIHDSEDEANETFEVLLSNVAGATVASATGFATIMPPARSAAYDSRVETQEDQPLQLNMSAFPHRVPEGKVIDKVEVSTAHFSLGTLELNGAAVADGTEVSVGDIDAGLLLFRPADDEFGEDYGRIDFRMIDTAGVASFAWARLSIDVESVNDLPTGQGGSFNVMADEPRVFSLDDFGFEDLEDSALTSVRIDTEPTRGTLLIGGSPVSASTVVPASAIKAGNFSFTSEFDTTQAHQDSFTFSVGDSEDFAATPSTMTFDVSIASRTNLTYHVELTDFAGNDVTSVNVGHHLLAHVYVTESYLFNGANGPYAAHLDLNYDELQLEVKSVTFDPEAYFDPGVEYSGFPVGTQYNALIPGIISNAGGADAEEYTGVDPQFLLTVEFEAVGGGTSAVVPSFPDLDSRFDSIVHKRDEPVPRSEIDFIASPTLTVNGPPLDPPDNGEGEIIPAEPDPMIDVDSNVIDAPPPDMQGTFVTVTTDADLSLDGLVEVTGENCRFSVDTGTANPSNLPSNSCEAVTYSFTVTGEGGFGVFADADAGVGGDTTVEVKLTVEGEEAEETITLNYPHDELQVDLAPTSINEGEISTVTVSNIDERSGYVLVTGPTGSFFIDSPLFASCQSIGGGDTECRVDFDGELEEEMEFDILGVQGTAVVDVHGYVDHDSDGMIEDDDAAPSLRINGAEVEITLNDHDPEAYEPHYVYVPDNPVDIGDVRLHGESLPTVDPVVLVMHAIADLGSDFVLSAEKRVNGVITPVSLEVATIGSTSSGVEYEVTVNHGNTLQNNPDIFLVVTPLADSIEIDSGESVEFSFDSTVDPSRPLTDGNGSGTVTIIDEPEPVGLQGDTTNEGSNRWGPEEEKELHGRYDDWEHGLFTITPEDERIAHPMQLYINATGDNAATPLLTPVPVTLTASRFGPGANGTDAYLEDTDDIADYRLFFVHYDSDKVPITVEQLAILPTSLPDYFLTSEFFEPELDEGESWAIEVAPIEDVYEEGNETVDAELIVNLPDNLLFGGPATVTIEDNELEAEIDKDMKESCSCVCIVCDSNDISVDVNEGTVSARPMSVSYVPVYYGDGSIGFVPTIKVEFSEPESFFEQDGSTAWPETIEIFLRVDSYQNDDELDYLQTATLHLSGTPPEGTPDELRDLYDYQYDGGTIAIRMPLDLYSLLEDHPELESAAYKISLTAKSDAGDSWNTRDSIFINNTVTNNDVAPGMNQPDDARLYPTDGEVYIDDKPVSGVFLVRPNNSFSFYKSELDGSFKTPTEETSELSLDGSNYSLTHRDESVDTFDSNGLRKSFKDSRGNITKYREAINPASIPNDFSSSTGIGTAQGRTIVEPSGRTTTLLHGKNGTLQHFWVVDYASRVTKFSYDSNTLLLTIQHPDPDGAGGASALTEEYQYEAVAFNYVRLQSVTRRPTAPTSNQPARTTTIRYRNLYEMANGGWGRVGSIVRPDGTEWQLKIFGQEVGLPEPTDDKNDPRRWLTEPRKRGSESGGGDDSDIRKSAYQPEEEFWRVGAVPNGERVLTFINQAVIVDARGNQTTLELDRFGRVLKEIDAHGQAWTYERPFEASRGEVTVDRGQVVSMATPDPDDLSSNPVITIPYAYSLDGDVITPGSNDDPPAGARQYLESLYPSSVSALLVNVRGPLKPIVTGINYSADDRLFVGGQTLPTLFGDPSDPDDDQVFSVGYGNYVRGIPQTYTNELGHVIEFDPDSDVGTNNSTTWVAPDALPSVERVGPNPWHNYAIPEDVNGDGKISALDALLVINFMGRELSSSGGSSVSLLNRTPSEDEHRYDVSNNNAASALDALLVINAIQPGSDGPTPILPPEVDFTVSYTYVDSPGSLAGTDLKRLLESETYVTLRGTYKTQYSYYLDQNGSFVERGLVKSAEQLFQPAGASGFQSVALTSYTYDARGYLDQVTERIDGSTNRVTDLDFDRIGRLVNSTIRSDVANELDLTVEYEYNAFNNLIRQTVVNELPAEIVGQANNVTERHTACYITDNMNRLRMVVGPNPDGEQAASVEEAACRTHVISPVGGFAQLPQEWKSRPIEQYEYDNNDNVIRMTRVTDLDAAGTPSDFDTTDLAYDRLDRLVNVKAPFVHNAGNQFVRPETSILYDHLGRAIAGVDAEANKMLFAYDEWSRPIHTLYPGPETPTTSDVATEFFSGDIDAIKLRRDNDNLPLFPLASTQYNATDYGWDVVSTDPLGRVTTVGYNFQNNPRFIQEPTVSEPGKPDQTPVSWFDYYEDGRLQTVTDANGHITSNSYNGLNLVDEVVYPIVIDSETGNATTPVAQYGYDMLGRMTSVTDPRGQVYEYRYNNIDSVTEVVYPDPVPGDGSSKPGMTYIHDAAGNVLRDTDALDHSTTYDYDGLFRLVSSQNANGELTTYQYDIASRLEVLTDSVAKDLTDPADPIANTTTWTYDDLDRVIEEADAQGRVRTFRYDLVSNLAKSTDRNGRTINYVYDNLYRMTSEQWANFNGQGYPPISYEYDLVGNLTGADDSTSESFDSVEYTFTYDALDRLTHETQLHDRLGKVFEFDRSYDSVGNLTNNDVAIGAHNGPGGPVSFIPSYSNAYTYDGMDRVVQIVQSGDAAVEKNVEFAYDRASRLTAIDRSTPNVTGSQTVSSSLGYDNVNRLTSLSHLGVVDYTWSYDAGNRMRTMDIDHADDDFDLNVKYFNAQWNGTQWIEASEGYDAANQLKAVTYTKGSTLVTFPSHSGREDYSYDDNGNRINDGGASPVGENNRLVTYDGYRYDYDAEGNLIARYVDEDSSGDLNAGDTDVTTYEWDHRNRLVKVIEDGKVVRQFYDAFNQWVGQEVDENGSTKSKSHVYDAGQIVMEYEDGDLTARNLWGRTVDMLLAIEAVTSETEDGTTYWPLTDHLGSVRDIVDTSGQLRNHRTYDSFGNQLEEQQFDASGNAISSSGTDAVDTIFGYTSRPRDESTGLQNNLHRWYDSELGRWISQDPIGFEAGDGNLYRYVGNDPPVALDPDGLETVWLNGVEVRVTRDGHHVIPVSVWAEFGFDASVADLLDGARIRSNERHLNDAAHIQYSDGIRADLNCELTKYAKKHAVGGVLSPAHQRKFIEYYIKRVTTGKGPLYLREFNRLVDRPAELAEWYRKTGVYMDSPIASGGTKWARLGKGGRLLFNTLGPAAGVGALILSDNKAQAANQLCLDVALPPVALAVDGGKLTAEATEALIATGATTREGTQRTIGRKTFFSATHEREPEPVELGIPSDSSWWPHNWGIWPWNW